MSERHLIGPQPADDLPFYYPTAATPTGARGRHVKATPTPEATRRSRNNRKRGGTWENDCARLLGGRRVGQLNLPWDVEVEGYARIQTKVLDRWPSLNNVVAWLDAIPAGRELRIVALRDTPGPGHPARRLVVMDADEFAAWHGKA